mmetsp:Transcript_21804/g.33318  ORF Transcript_21804/g.33318 Transcript_21804/m.33318 type:complete len:265 (+) Transcript_21804:110-904(+)|eukprot:CAMPEP_0196802874 /NCGR_PEP_ID=MMETSP1362-20130617/2399_1 /TAXON_ID=163516 /ORGANISM="Leptocylindrus danicus, Strain CCMP1856" /LENGTH=264 /DNA_ID=CAMNT_0042174277 /DNA_START=110 /DNA_END=904 /DNA_ORIENTATION=+
MPEKSEKKSYNGSISEVRWIEAQGNDYGTDRRGEEMLGSLFDDPDPHDIFIRDFHVPSQNLDISVTIRGMKAENGQTLASTGMTLWRASDIMCNYLAQNADDIEGRRCLELGGGLGQCGILAYKLGAKRMIITDGDSDVLFQMRKNVDANLEIPGGSTMVLPCRQLLWKNSIDQFKERWCTREEVDGFDVIMGSDVIYQEDTIEPLFYTVAELLSKDNEESKFYLAYARRNVKIDMVLECAKSFGLEWREPTSVEGVYVFTWKR